GQTVLGERLPRLPLRPWPTLDCYQRLDQLEGRQSVDPAVGEDRADVGEQLDPDRIVLDRCLDRLQRLPGPLPPLAARNVGNRERRTPIVSYPVEDALRYHTHQRLDLLFEIVAIDLVDLGCNLDRQSGALGNTDGAVDAFLRRNATEKRKIVWLHRLRRQQLRGQTVIDRLDPAGLRHGPALRVRYRNHRYRRERREHRLKLRQIEPSM